MITKQDFKKHVILLSPTQGRVVRRRGVRNHSANLRGVHFDLCLAWAERTPSCRVRIPAALGWTRGGVLDASSALRRRRKDLVPCHDCGAPAVWNSPVFEALRAVDDLVTICSPCMKRRGLE